MSAVMSRSADFYTSTDQRSVDELDAAIGCLVRQMNADSYRMLVLVREFDDRYGWKKWTFKCCAEWLAWRSSISLSAAREKVRAAHALRALPTIAAAFAEGRLSYSKVRALTRVAHACTMRIYWSRTRSMRRPRRSRSGVGRFATSRQIQSSRTARMGAAVVGSMAR